MKKVLTAAVALLFAGTMMAQTIVSTTPQNRNVIIEEFTGVNCGYCPDGHRIVNEIIEANNGRVAGINIHQGSYANGSPYTTQYGDALANQTGLTGYPAGTVNRHVFSGSSTALGRGSFAQASQMIMGMPSPVNIAAVGTLDPYSRQMIVHIEIYYTETSNNGVNFLNIAILQNNVMGNQSGASTYYPEMVVNGQYRHNHMLRDLLTGQWGEQIDATQGNFIDTTIIYTIPQAIGSVAIPDIEDIDMVVFITEGHQEIITGVKAMIVHDVPNLTNFKVKQVADCSLDYQPYVTIENCTESDLISFEFDYDGTTYVSNKRINALSYDTINLPIYTIVPGTDAVQNCTTTKTVSLESCTTIDNDDLSVSSPTKSVTFANFNLYRVAGPMQLRAVIDGYGSECSVQLVNQSNCTPEWTWHEDSWTDIGPQSAQYVSQLHDGRPYWMRFDPPTPGLYILRVVDSYGDGWRWTNNDHPSGIWLNDANGEVISDSWGYTNGPSFAYYDYYLNVTTSGDGSHVDIDNAAAVSFDVYPNPVNDRMYINSSETLRQVEILDMSGRTVMNCGNQSSIDTKALATGVYMLRVVTENGVNAQKFVKE